MESGQHPCWEDSGIEKKEGWSVRTTEDGGTIILYNNINGIVQEPIEVKITRLQAMWIMGKGVVNFRDKK